MHSFNDTFGTSGLRGWNGLAVEKARVMLVAGSMNQARRWVTACWAYRDSLVRTKAAVRAGTHMLKLSTASR